MVVMALLAGAFACARLHWAADGDVTRFVVAGDLFTDARDRPSNLHVFPGDGYDGQFAYRLAVAPFDWSDVSRGVAVDKPLRFQRIVYPTLAYVVSGGAESRAPLALVLVNIGALIALAGIGAALARGSGRHALWGLLFPLYFGFVSTLARDLHEIVEVALLLAALLALRNARWVLGAVLLSGAVLTRETALFAVAGLALFRLVEIGRRRTRPGVPDLAWVVPGVAFAVLQAGVRLATGSFPASSGGGLSWPAHDLARSIPHWFRDLSSGTWAVHTVEGIVLVSIVAGALLLLPGSTVPTREKYVFGFLVLGALTAWIGDGSLWLATNDLRMFADVYALAIIVLLGSRILVAVPASAVAVVTGAAAYLSVKSI